MGIFEDQLSERMQNAEFAQGYLDSKAEIDFLEDHIARLPAQAVLTRRSFETRLRMAKERLAELEAK